MLLCEMYPIPKLTLSIIQLISCTWKGRETSHTTAFYKWHLKNAGACTGLSKNHHGIWAPDYVISKQDWVSSPAPHSHAPDRPAAPGHQSGGRRARQPRLVPLRLKHRLRVEPPRLHLQPAQKGPFIVPPFPQEGSKQFTNRFNWS